jgi:hypothetical protein
VAAESRYVNAEWLMALHQDRLILPCTLDEAPLPQCLAGNVFLNLRTAGEEAVARLTRAIRDAGDAATPLAPLIRSESPELTAAIAEITEAQGEVMAALGVRELDKAAELQAKLDPVMERAQTRWSLDPMIVNLGGYHLKNAYMLEHWDAIQAGRAPKDPLLDRAERRFFETLAIDPTDPSALNGLGNILVLRARPRRGRVLPPHRDRGRARSRNGELPGGGAGPRAGAALPARVAAPGAGERPLAPGRA